jgi:tyrosinase
MFEGHYAMGGDPGRDVFVSPGDPLFYLHHGMIDLVWFVWQLLDPKTRMQGPTAIAATRTFFNQPPRYVQRESSVPVERGI